MSRLQKIKFEYQNSPIRRTRQLISIQQFGKTDGESLPAVRFEYYDEEKISFSVISYNRTANHDGLNGTINESTVFADMNGDGLVDKVQAYGDGSFNVYFNTGNDFVKIPGRSHWIDPFMGWSDPGMGDPPWKGKLNAFRDGHQWLFLIDMNGDNLPDRVGRVLEKDIGTKTERVKFRIAFNNGRGWGKIEEWNDPYVGNWAGTTDHERGLIDMNGDGLVDRVIGDRTPESFTVDSYGRDKGNFLVFKNNGRGFEEKPDYWRDPLTQYSTSHSERAHFFAADDVKTLVGPSEVGEKTFLTIRDINGDGLPDRIFKSNLYKGDELLGIGFTIFLNDGKKWGLPLPVPGKPMQVFVNGVDVIGFVDPVTDKGSKGYLDKKHDFIDINGDGFLDRVEGGSSGCKIRYYIYRGMTIGEDFAQLSSAIELIDPIDDMAFDSEGKPKPPQLEACGYLSNYSQSSEERRYFAFFQDFNGDGLPDRLVLHDRSLTALIGKADGFYKGNYYEYYPLNVNALRYIDNIPSWWKNRDISQPIGALKKVIDQQGRDAVIEYQPSTWPTMNLGDSEIPHHNRFLPFNLNLVREVYTTDHSLKPPPPYWTYSETDRHHGMRVTTYKFRGGNFFVRNATSASSRFARFNGFQEVEKRVYPGYKEDWGPYKTVTHYHQAIGDVDPLPTGLTDGFEKYGYQHFALSGKPYRQFVEEIDTKKQIVRQETYWQINSKGGNFECGPDSSTKVERCYPRQAQVMKWVFEKGAVPVRLSRVEYHYNDLGNVTSEITSDGSSGVWKTLLSKETIYKAPFGKGSVIRDRPETQLKKGPDGTVWRKKTFEYDTWGNPTGETFFVDAAGTKTLKIKRTFNSNGTLSTMTDTDGVTKEIGYDPAELFPISETVKTPSGTPLTTTRAFNRLNGEVSLEIGPQKVGKRIYWDSFGRKAEEWLRSAAGVETPVRRFRYDYFAAKVDGWSGINLLRTQVWEIKPDHPETDTKPAEITWTDGSGQVLQNCALSERGNYRLRQFRVENGGRRELQTEPVFSGTCDFISSLASGIRTYRKEKDLTGRETYLEPPPGDSSSPVGTVSINYTTNSSGHLVKTTTNPKGEITIEEFDGFERLAEVTDPAGSVTEYTYNPVGDLENVTGAGKILTTIKYDLMGRKTEMTDADMGTWKYEYDDLGRLKTQTDNKGQKVVFWYDSLGRIQEKRNLRADGGLDKKEVSTYDTGTALPGELYQVEEFQGKKVRTTRFAYDPLYRRTSKLTRSINGLGTFEQDLTHDYLGRVTETRYPGGHKLLYYYMMNGNLKEVCGDLCDLAGVSGEIYYSLDPATSYDVFGALQKESYGNGITSEYKYYTNSHRLQEKTIKRGPEVYDKKDFQYDKMSNILKLGGTNDWGSLSDITYDNRDRLTSYTPKKGSGVQTLTYDLRGNILKNTASFGDKAYEYTSPRPHAVTKIGTDLFDYDLNGNMTSDPSRKMIYNASNQLARVDMSSGDVVTYDYDYTGARVSKQVDHKDVYHKVTRSTTHYLGDAIELTNKSLV